MSAIAMARLDRSLTGLEITTVSITVEPVQLRLFVKAIGDTDRIHSDAQAARAAGYRNITIPPTYLFCLHMTALGDSHYAFFTDRGIALGRLLHGEQSFTYHQPVCLGDELVFHTRVSDVIDKKSGAMTVLIEHVRVTAGSVLAAELTNTVVIRNDD